MTHDPQDDRLEALFQEARRDAPQVPQALMTRVMADAATLQRAPKPPLWQHMFRILGGAPGLGGLVTATCVGFWIGIAPPVESLDLAVQFWGASGTDDAEISFDVLTSFGWDVEEG